MFEVLEKNPIKLKMLWWAAIIANNTCCYMCWPVKIKDKLDVLDEKLSQWYAHISISHCWMLEKHSLIC